MERGDIMKRPISRQIKNITLKRYAFETEREIYLCIYVDDNN